MTRLSKCNKANLHVLGYQLSCILVRCVTKEVTPYECSLSMYDSVRAVDVPKGCKYSSISRALKKSMNKNLALLCFEYADWKIHKRILTKQLKWIFDSLSYMLSNGREIRTDDCYNMLRIAEHDYFHSIYINDMMR